MVAPRVGGHDRDENGELLWDSLEQLILNKQVF